MSVCNRFAAYGLVDCWFTPSQDAANSRPRKKLQDPSLQRPCVVAWSFGQWKMLLQLPTRFSTQLKKGWHFFWRFLGNFSGARNNRGFGGCSLDPTNCNEGTKSGTTDPPKNGTTVPKTGTRVHSPKPPFYETALNCFSNFGMILCFCKRLFEALSFCRRAIPAKSAPEDLHLRSTTLEQECCRTTNDSPCAPAEARRWISVDFYRGILWKFWREYCGNIADPPN